MIGILADDRARSYIPERLLACDDNVNELSIVSFLFNILHYYHSSRARYPVRPRYNNIRNILLVIKTATRSGRDLPTACGEHSRFVYLDIMYRIARHKRWMDVRANLYRFIKYFVSHIII